MQYLSSFHIAVGLCKKQLRLQLFTFAANESEVREMYAVSYIRLDPFV